MSTRLQLSTSPSPARARPLVVDLFTSQSCSPCRPAQALLGEFATRPDLLPRGFDLGCASRQQAAYASRLEDGSFTPQFVIEGRRSVVRSRRAAVAATLVQAKVKARSATELSVLRRDDRIAVSLGSRRGMTRLLVIGFYPAHPALVRPGENAGRAIEQADVKRFRCDLGTWEGWPIGLDAPSAAEEGQAMIWPQAGSWIDGAARLSPSA
ncbi:DUF1223 domain-containing protein [Methylobacterium sp. 190mf]|uniref:DUF1223 domain-containing protein n=1 Tax=Methylobacterium sp. 190mf TaxID=1761798 RepID=UPI000CDE7CEF|nr:DUF1223 domain-containing protein [Methylobacterium sp. 190mf]